MHEPVGQEQGLAGVAQAHAAAADQHPQRGVEVPGAADQRRQHQAGAHQDDTQFHHHPRTPRIHQPAEQRAQRGGDDKAEGEGASGDASVPAELGEDRWEQQREGGARVDAYGHGHEHHGDDDPAIEERPRSVEQCGHLGLGFGQGSTIPVIASDAKQSPPTVRVACGDSPSLRGAQRRSNLPHGTHGPSVPCGGLLRRCAPRNDGWRSRRHRSVSFSCRAGSR